MGSLRRVVQLRCCLLFFYSQVWSFRPVAGPIFRESMLETIRSETGQEDKTMQEQPVLVSIQPDATGYGSSWLLWVVLIQPDAMAAGPAWSHLAWDHSTGPAWEAIGPAWGSRQSVDHLTGPTWEAIGPAWGSSQSVPGRALSPTALVHYPQPRLVIAGGAASGLLNRSRRESSIW